MRILSGAKQSRNRGFTLIELLVVIAIIGILASIVVPKIGRYLAKAQVVKAVAEIRNIDTALVGALSDTGRSSFRGFLTAGARETLDGYSISIMGGSGDPLEALAAATKYYNDFFYELLRLGRESKVMKTNVEPEVLHKLGTSYMDIGLDSWGNQYQFWMGPLRKGAMPLRSYRIRTDGDAVYWPDDPEFTSIDAYIYNEARRDQAQRKFPGQPRRDDDRIRSAFESTFGGIEAYGFPAPKDLPVYVWSKGENLESDAHLLLQMYRGVDEEFPEFLGGGDDPNNWDNASGWEDAPR